MHVRSIKPEDFSEVASFTIAAFEKDELSDFIYPYRDQHPAEFRYANLRRIRKRYYSGQTMLVAVTDEKDTDWDGREKAVGLAFLETHGGQSAPTVQPSIWNGSSSSTTDLDHMNS